MEKFRKIGLIPLNKKESKECNGGIKIVSKTSIGDIGKWCCVNIPPTPIEFPKL